MKSCSGRISWGSHMQVQVHPVLLKPTTLIQAIPIQDTGSKFKNTFSSQAWFWRLVAAASELPNFSYYPVLVILIEDSFI